MPSYSNERREAVVAKLLPPRNLPVREVAQQEGISEPTVYKWGKEAREQGRCLPNAGDGGTAAWSSKDKFAAVLETAAMNGAELAEYCRRRGVYPEQIAAWRQDCEQAASLSQQERRQEALEGKAQRDRIRELERDLRRKNAALAETAALLTLSKKSQGDLGGPGIMISTPDRQQAVTLIAVARTEGARLEPACTVVGITVRTHQRWTREGDVREDQRPLVDRAAPANALCAEETQAILDACHRPDHASLPPDQIVVRLLDQEALYLGSVSTFYRVLRRHGEVTHRGACQNTQAPGTADDVSRQRTQPVVELGLFVAAWTGQGHLLLPGDDHRHLQPQGRRLGGLPGRVGRQRAWRS